MYFIWAYASKIDPKNGPNIGLSSKRNIEVFIK